MATLQEQLDWESFHKSLGVHRLEDTLDKAKEKGRITDTPLGSVVLKKYLKQFSHAISKDLTEDLNKPGQGKHATPLLMALDVDEVSLVALKTVINLVGGAEDGYSTAVSLAYQIGRNLYAELVLASFQDMAPDLYDVLVHDMQRRLSRDVNYRLTVFKIQAQKEGIELPMWTRRQRILVGVYLLNILSSPEFGLELLVKRTVREGKKTRLIIEATEAITDVFEAMRITLRERMAVVAPCLVPPQDWTGEPNVGGFHGLLKVRAPRWYKGASGLADIYETHGANLTVALASLNAHQKVAWKVNPYIFNLVQEMDKRGMSIEDSVEFTATVHQNMPPEPAFLAHHNGEDFTAAEQEMFTAWKKKKRQWYIDLNKAGRAESRVRSAMEAARGLLESKEFFYVHQKDVRMRGYPNGGQLNPQGSDVQKALLHAAHGEPMDTPEAVWWFKLSLAAKYGVDKLSPDECVQWVDDNEDNIKRAAEDPLNRDAFYWWSEADKPLQFIAVCDEYRRFLQNPDTFINRIAVAMDGSCNGLQNYSALLRDEVGGRSTNLIQSESGRPEDIYKDVAKAAYKRLLKQPDSVYRRAWLDLIVDRSLTKKPVMTKVYNSKYVTCRKAVMAFCKKHGYFLGEEYEYADYAAKLVWAAIGDVVVKAEEAMEWLGKSATAIMREGAEYIIFRAPNGAIVVQEYNKYNLQRIKSRLGSEVQIQIQTDLVAGPNRIKHRNSFPPNFIHSVDASHMDYVSVRMSKEVPGLFMHFIHDDFGVLAKHAPLLSRVIREEFVKMHQGYSLEALREFYPFLEDPPERGNLDITEVLKSMNFFR